MEEMAEEDPEKYKLSFSKFIENDIEADGLEDLYTECHEKIRENPDREYIKHDEPITNTRKGNQIQTSKGTNYTRKVRLSKEERKGRVAQIIKHAASKIV